jgi:hypothetical protein
MSRATDRRFVHPDACRTFPAQLPSGVFMRNSRAVKKMAATVAEIRPTPSNVNTQVCAPGAVAKSIDQSYPPAGTSQRTTNTRK